MAAGTAPSRTLPRRGNLAVVAAVDAALGAAAAQRLLTRDDAAAILRRVREGIDAATNDIATGEALRILDAAIASCENDLLIDRERVVDALLDVRLTLSL